MRRYFGRGLDGFGAGELISWTAGASKISSSNELA